MLQTTEAFVQRSQDQVAKALAGKPANACPPALLPKCVALSNLVAVYLISYPLPSRLLLGASPVPFSGQGLRSLPRNQLSQLLFEHPGFSFVSEADLWHY